MRACRLPVSFLTAPRHAPPSRLARYFYTHRPPHPKQPPHLTDKVRTASPRYPRMATKTIAKQIFRESITPSYMGKPSKTSCPTPSLSTPIEFNNSTHNSGLLSKGRYSLPIPPQSANRCQLPGRIHHTRVHHKTRARRTSSRGLASSYASRGVSG